MILVASATEWSSPAVWRQPNPALLVKLSGHGGRQFQCPCRDYRNPIRSPGPQFIFWALVLARWRTQTCGWRQPTHDKVSCLLPRSIHWLRHARRFLIPQERFALQGWASARLFPEGFSREELDDLSGNMFNGVIIGAVLVALCSHIPICSGSRRCTCGVEL